LKTSFLSNMSHEIRTPLNTIFGAIDLSIAQKDPEQCAHYLDIAKQSGELLSSIISDILDFAKIESGEIKNIVSVVSLRQTLQEISETANIMLERLKKDIIIETEIADSVAEYIEIDYLKLKQILLNLVSNALKYSETGVVKVIANSSNDTHIEFQVSDSGSGMSEEELQSVFIPFRQLETRTKWDHSGTGLGLPIVKNLVAVMNGKINVISSTGAEHGTTFTLSFPCKFHSTHNSKTSECLPVASQNINVLLVEDNLLNLKITKKLLENNNAIVTTAVNGKEALAVFKSAKFDLILMDLQMPEMNGMEATQKIRQYEKDQGMDKTCIVALTADATRETMDECTRNGFNFYFTKPLNSKMLNEFIAKRLACG